MRTFVAGAVIALAAAAFAVVVLLGDAPPKAPGYGDRVHDRPLTVHVGRSAARLAVGPCVARTPDARDRCSEQAYPRTVLPALRPGKTLRFTFSSTGRVEATAWRRSRGGYARVGRWNETIQCIDSACAASLRIRADRPPPRRADTLRLVLFGDPSVGAEVRLRP